MRAIRSSLLVPLCSAATVAVLATGGALVAANASTAGRGHTKPPAETTLSIRNKAIAHRRHHADAIAGVLRSHHKGVVGATISLDSRTGKKPRWAVVATGTTGAGGAVTFTVAPAVRTEYKLVFAGTSSLRRSHSNVITLKAARK
jgi:hypothetical protein